MTTTVRPEEFARLFPQNGMKLLLHHGLNVDDLLRLSRFRQRRALDLTRLEVDPTNYVQRDFHHVESDLVLRVPYRRKGRTLILYLLIEHQSEPDRLMAFRVLEYVVEIYRGQLRDWARTHETLTGFVFQPVLPVVFYTGARTWRRVGKFADLVAAGTALDRAIPALEPLFVNLAELPDERLVSEGGYFGQVLRLVQRRRARRSVFRTLLGEVVQALEAMPEAQKLRWQELLSYTHALVYHEREQPERAPLYDHIERSVRSEQHRQEVTDMRKTIAQAEREETRLETKRDMLIRLLEERFGTLAPSLVATIQTCTDEAQLDNWVLAVVRVRRLADIGIRSQE